jgi:hypothetical protein
VYSTDTAVFKIFEWIGIVSGLQGHIISLKEQNIMGKTGLFSKGTAQIHFINWIGGI